MPAVTVPPCAAVAYPFKRSVTITHADYDMGPIFLAPMGKSVKNILCASASEAEGENRVISNLKLWAGSTPGAPGLDIPLTPVTVFVGPNNSGKSLALREVEQICRGASGGRATFVVESVKLEPQHDDVIDQFLSDFQVEPGPNEFIQPGNIFIQSRVARLQVQPKALRDFARNPETNLQYFCSAFVSHLTLRLDASGRINLCNPQQAGDMQAPAQNKLAELFKKDARRSEISKIVYDSLGAHLVADPTNLGQIRLRLSEVAPRDLIEEKGLHPEAVEFHARALEVQHASDGVKAFVGILVEIFMGNPKVVLIDEPEAFLHPSLARRLGREISLAASSEGKKIFVSTHSPSFLMGCIESHVPVNIVRLTYNSKISTARVLDSASLLRLMRNPLLRSTNVLDGLFYENVVVTESDADRAFYQQVNERLLRYDPTRGLNNCLFINAQNKQTVPTIAEPLRALGIAATMIVDVDVLKCKGAEWQKFAAAGRIPAIRQDSLSAQRDALLKALEATGKNMKRDGGIALLQGDDLRAAKDFLEATAEYGLFIVPGGELECWLKQIGAAGHGPYWLIQMFEKMGEDPDQADYLKPQQGDVWDFISGMRPWLLAPDRKGMPLAA